MKGYLLDTNHLAAICNRQPAITAKVKSLPPDTQLRVCAITLGEYEVGHRITATTHPAKRAAATAVFVREFLPNSLNVSLSTRLYYADLVERIYKHNPKPASGRMKTETYLLKLGVDINDVWIVAVAWEHGLTFLTSDNMLCIRNAVPELTWDCWI